MSYPQFGYAYSPTAAASSTLASSQLLVPGAGGSLPGTGGGASATSIAAATTCCTADTTRPPLGGGGAGPGLPGTPGSDPSSPSGGAGGATGAGSVYSSSLLSYPRVAGLADSVGTVYGSAYAAQGYVPFGSDPSAFYSPLGTDNNDAWRNLSQPGWPYDPTGMAGYPYGTSYGGLDVRRKNATRESTSTLKAWLYEHIKNPYPTKGEKIMLAIITKMTLTQVSTWFANARRRLKKENKMQWSPRNRTGEDDDDDKDGSDVEGSEKEAKSGDKRDHDDEDINIVDSGTDHHNPLLSPTDGMSKIASSHDPVHDKRDIFGDLKTDLSGLSGASSSDLSGLRGDHLGGLKDHHHEGLDCLGEDANGNKLDPHGGDKPRIWSLADVATSSTPPLGGTQALLGGAGRRSPSCPLTNTTPSNLGISKTTAFSPPPPHAPGSSLAAGPGGFHPWSAAHNGGSTGAGGYGSAGSSSSTGGLSSSSPNSSGLGSYGSPFSSPHGTPVATPMGGLTTPGGHQGPRVGGGPGQSPHGPMSGGMHPSYSSVVHKLQNGLMGDKHDLSSSGFHSSQDDTGTAFKPVTKRL